MIKGFKEFIAQGNALELTVAVIIGAAFKPIVDAITKVILDIIGQIVGQPNFDSIGQFKISTRLMKDARVRGSVPHVGLPAKLVDRGGHGKWVVDAGQGRDHGKVRQGVHQGVEEGQGTDP